MRLQERKEVSAFPVRGGQLL